MLGTLGVAAFAGPFLPFARRMESRIPGLFVLGFGGGGGSYSGAGTGFGCDWGALISSGKACDEWARKDSAVSQI